MIRRTGEVPRPDQSYKRRPGVYAILPIGRRFLLTAQISDVVDIQLPGGGIDPGESPLQALYREVREEIGWSIASPRRIGAFRRFVFMPDYEMWAEKICHIYVAHPARQIQAPSEPDHETLILDTDDALAALGCDGGRGFLERYVASRP